MPVRDLSVIFSIIDRASKPLEFILQKKKELEGKDITVTANVDADTSGAEALEGSLDQLDGAASKVKGTLDKTTESEKKEAQAAKQAGQETKGAGDAAKYSDSILGRLHSTVDGLSTKFSSWKDTLEPLKTKLLALNAVVLGFAAVAVNSAGKTEEMVDELNHLKGPDFSKAIQQWAEAGSGKAWSGKQQRLAIGLDLSELDMSSGDIQKFGTEIEKFYFTKLSSMKRLGISSAEDLTQSISNAAKGGRTEELRRVLESGSITDSKMNNEMARLRANYEKFAFATDDVVKKQALMNLTMKALQETNSNFTGEATTYSQKLELLWRKWDKLAESIGDKLIPAADALIDTLSDLMTALDEIPGGKEILIFIGILIGLLGMLSAAVFTLAPGLKVLAALFKLMAGEEAIGGIAGITTGLGGVTTALGGVATAASAALLPLLPYIIVIAVIAGALYLLYTRTTVLQDSWAKLTSIATRAQAVFQKITSTVNGALKGNKADLQTIGDWVRNFLDGLIPGWLSDIFASAGGYFRKAMSWFSQIMDWWNNFLKKVNNVSDAIKSMLGISAGKSDVIKSPEKQALEAAGITNVNNGQGIKGADAGIPTAEADQMYLGLDPNRVNKTVADLMAKYNLKPGEAFRVGNKLGVRGPKGEISSVDMGSDMDQLIAAQKKDAAETHNASYFQRGSVKLSDIEKVAPELVKALTAVNNGTATDKVLPESTGQINIPGLGDTPISFKNPTTKHQGEQFVDSNGDTWFWPENGSAFNHRPKGSDYVTDSPALNQAPQEVKDYYGIPQAAKGASVNSGGQIEVHDREEIVPAKIVEGTGKLGSLLRDALSWRNSDINAPRAVAEESGPRGSVQAAPGGNIQVSLNVENHFHVSQAVDLSRLDVTKLIDWNRAGYEIEKIQKRFRAQQG